MKTRDGNSPKGRGAGSNPANRFERLEVVPEEPCLDRVSTLYLRDASRSIIATNDSPDVGFDASLNPYRGCEHGCIYCLGGDTPILMGDGTTRPLRALKAGDSIYGTRREGWYRRYVRTRVLAHWESKKRAYAVTLADGTRLVASADHRFLTERGWKFVTGAEQGVRRRPHLTENNKLMGIGRFAISPDLEDEDYRRGYLCGVIRGDAHLASYEYERAGRAHGNQHKFRLALADHEALDRARTYLAEFGIAVQEFTFQEATVGYRRIDAIRTSAQVSVESIRGLVSWPLDSTDQWRRGFLAGIYDAEGSYSVGNLRISNTDTRIVDEIGAALRFLGFSFVLERPRAPGNRPVQVVRLTGGLTAHLRFWHSTENAIVRKRDIEGSAVKSSASLDVRSVEPCDEAVGLYDITTGTGDFIADGVVSHNCYARPTHEFLGFSAGLEFETRILVKESAPSLLERELRAPSWRPRTLALSGVTDPYQPVERKLQLTRRCLGVLARHRNPVVVITKNALVRRDCDHLESLARHRAAAVFLSVTTLRAELTRVMEPRTSVPELRLQAIRELAEAGIPVGVLVAPVIPGLTDHEIPEILAAASEAGATHARYVLLRLPGPVEELFLEWIDRHVPDRKKRILNRLRSLRGGKLSESAFGKRMRGEGVFADQIRGLFRTACRRHGLAAGSLELSAESFVREPEQGRLF